MTTLIVNIEMLPCLKAGDRVALIAPGSPKGPEERAKKTCDFLLKHSDLNASYNEDCFNLVSAQTRAEFFLESLFDSNIKALWAFRGGEGTGDVIPFIDEHRDKIAKLTPKLLIGFSDITVLLLYFSQLFNWPIVHGSGVPQMLENKVDDLTTGLALDLVMGRLNEIKIDKLESLNSAAKKSGNISGKMSGGNLSLLHCGTKEVWELQSKDKILVIEDVNERPHVVRRTLNHLKRIGTFDGAKAIIFGDFATADSKSAPKLQEVLTHFASNCEIPVLFTPMIGHGQTNIPLVFGAEATLFLSENQKSHQVSLERTDYT